MLFKNAYVLNEDFKFEKLAVETDGAEIISVSKDAGGEGVDLSGKYLIPGLVDMHTHGAVGTDTMDEDFDFHKWQKYLLSYGVTTFFPTTVSAHDDVIKRTMQKLASIDGVSGINLEGPYINADKRGAHDIDTIRPADFDEFSKYQNLSGNKIKITTIAPEIDGNIEFIRKASKTLKVALGHSSADYDSACKGINAGATQLTHTFNAMNPFTHREPNMVGAALETENVFCEVISDGIHLHPSTVRTLFKILGDERMVLISDSMAATGLADGEYMLGSMHVTVKNSVARTDDGAIAGSTKNLMQMVRSAISFGIPLESAVKCASLNPAKSVGIDNKYGSITVGKTADFVICDKDLNIFAVVKNGVYITPEN